MHVDGTNPNPTATNLYSATPAERVAEARQVAELRKKMRASSIEVEDGLEIGGVSNPDIDAEQDSHQPGEQQNQQNQQEAPPEADSPEAGIPERFVPERFVEEAVTPEAVTSDPGMEEALFAHGDVSRSPGTEGPLTGSEDGPQDDTDDSDEDDPGGSPPPSPISIWG